MLLSPLKEGAFQSVTSRLGWLDVLLAIPRGNLFQKVCETHLGEQEGDESDFEGGDDSDEDDSDGSDEEPDADEAVTLQISDEEADATG